MLTPELLAEILPHLRRELGEPTLEITVKPQWSRSEIRAGLIAALPELSEVERELLARLEFIPDPPGARVSISHTPTLGGFALSRGSAAIGLDLEDVARVHAKAVARVSKPTEQAPSPALLWCAKEAAFKALRGRPKVLSNLTTSAWRSVSAPSNFSLWSSEVREDSQPNAICRGLCVELSGTALAIFLEQR